MADHTLAALIADLRRHGFTARPTRHGLLWSLRGYRFLSAHPGRPPGDWRALTNDWRRWHRIRRQLLAETKGDLK